MLGDFILWLRQFFCIHDYERAGILGDKICKKCDRVKINWDCD